jgi:hypothetical protein
VMTRHDAPRTEHRALAIWRAKPAIILGLYVLLLLAGASSGPLGHAAGIAPGHIGDSLLVSWVVTLLLVWRVWRRGQVSRCLLIFGSGFGCVDAAWHVPGHRAALILLVIDAGQLALMLSPALSRHDGPQADDASPCA